LKAFPFDCGCCCAVACRLPLAWFAPRHPRDGLSIDLSTVALAKAEVTASGTKFWKAIAQIQLEFNAKAQRSQGAKLTQPNPNKGVGSLRSSNGDAQNGQPWSSKPLRLCVLALKRFR
jgi:hypothetical protein